MPVLYPDARMMPGQMTTDGQTMLATTAEHAPDAPGVYFFLNERAELLYVGKATSIRKRLQQHAHVAPAGERGYLNPRYHLVREVRWKTMPDEKAATAWETDLIVVLRPPYNAGPRSPWNPTGRDRGWLYVAVTATRGDTSTFRLVDAVDRDADRVYGCFPHLGKGLGSLPGVSCSDGYPALLRLLWARAPSGDVMPRAITRTAPPQFEVAIAGIERESHDFLSGVSERLLATLAQVVTDRPAHVQPALARDLAAAQAFFEYGPKAVRTFRRRHGLRPGPVPRERYVELVRRDAHEAIGDFVLPTSPA